MFGRKCIAVIPTKGVDMALWNGTRALFVLLLGVIQQILQGWRVRGAKVFFIVPNYVKGRKSSNPFSFQIVSNLATVIGNHTSHTARARKFDAMDCELPDLVNLY